jgi:HSP20 family protein
MYLNINPWREFQQLQNDMNELFRRTGTQYRREYPAVNIWANQDEALVTAELAGYDASQIQLSVLADVLSIKGNRDQQEIKENEQYHRQECCFGNFEREIRLPFHVDSNKIKARMDRGVLKIQLPRAEEDKPKKIEIKSN